MTKTLFDELPRIQSFYISFIKLYSLPTFDQNKNGLLQNYPFLSSIKDYSHYYRLNEVNGYGSLSNLPGLGYLKPIMRKHSMNTYWKLFRKNNNFTFMPLEIRFSVKKLRIDGIDYPLKVSTLIFPFGSIAIYIDVKIRNLSMKFDQTIDFINRIYNNTMISLNSVSIEPCDFNILCKNITRRINSAFLGIDESLRADSSHSVLFLQNLDKRLYFDKMSKGQDMINHLLGFASLIANEKLVESLEREFIDKLLSIQLKEKWREETILFTPSRSVLVPSISWLESLSKSSEQKYRDLINDENQKSSLINERLTRSCRCMFKNYLHCICTLFAVNTFYRNNPTGGDFNKVIEDTFGKKISASDYYKHAIEPISERIGLSNKMSGKI